MLYTRLGDTGLEISRLCIGCMSFGIPDRGPHEWTLGEAEGKPLDLGIPAHAEARMGPPVRRRCFGVLGHGSHERCEKHLA